MGNLIAMLKHAPSIIKVYNAVNYDPFHVQQNKMVNPNGATTLVLPLPNKEEARVSPWFFPVLTRQEYKMAWNNQRSQVYNTDRIELDPVLYRDYRPGASLQYANGIYKNEAIPGGPMTLYDYINSRNRYDCGCH